MNDMLRARFGPPEDEAENLRKLYDEMHCIIEANIENIKNLTLIVSLTKAPRITSKNLIRFFPTNSISISGKVSISVRYSKHL
ncbi:hypothetical protein CARUB_v10006708mg [Capsella rubella]|uniref:Uncharacterized protein n=1 Tax=Capsella rubella TaxID=81985 RepID=R0GMU5_9BRAS|nr:hypothetical protein CARUB_v10006708mg [Capsella rubella]